MGWEVFAVGTRVNFCRIWKMMALHSIRANLEPRKQKKKKVETLLSTYFTRLSRVMSRKPLSNFIGVKDFNVLEKKSQVGISEIMASYTKTGRGSDGLTAWKRIMEQDRKGRRAGDRTWWTEVGSEQLLRRTPRSETYRNDDGKILCWM